MALSSTFIPSKWKISPFQWWDTSTAMYITLMASLFALLVSVTGVMKWGNIELIYYLATSEPHGMNVMFWQQVDHQTFLILCHLLLLQKTLLAQLKCLVFLETSCNMIQFLIPIKWLRGTGDLTEGTKSCCLFGMADLHREEASEFSHKQWK